MRTVPWSEVEARYAKLAALPAWDIAPMCSLVAYLAQSPYADGLFPFTSMDVLCLGRVRDFADEDGQLRVQFDRRTQRFEFTYLQAPFAKPWRGRCAAAGFETYLDRLLRKRLRWFSAAAPA
jgi:hypothetical protein